MAKKIETRAVWLVDEGTGEPIIKEESRKIHESYQQRSGDKRVKKPIFKFLEDINEALKPK